MNNIDKLIEQGAELARKQESIRNEILNNPDIPQELKDAMIGLGDTIIPTLNIIDKDKKIKRINPDTFEIEYEYENTNHRYYPDIYIKSENQVIEAKSTYTFNKEKEKNLLKRDSVLNKNINFKFVIL